MSHLMSIYYLSLYSQYLYLVLYWPAQPDDPSTIRVASVIAFSEVVT